jgi:hypothetical protein
MKGVSSHYAFKARHPQRALKDETAGTKAPPTATLAALWAYRAAPVNRRRPVDPDRSMREAGRIHRRSTIARGAGSGIKR